jgi:aryl carrier-like protein
MGEVVMGNLAGTITAEPTTSIEGILAGMLADVIKAEQVPVDGHFFEELGADSLVMAKFCARVRKREGLPSVSMKDIYAHPTIRSRPSRSR